MTRPPEYGFNGGAEHPPLELLVRNTETQDHVNASSDEVESTCVSWFWDRKDSGVCAIGNVSAHAVCVRGPK